METSFVLNKKAQGGQIETSLTYQPLAAEPLNQSTCNFRYGYSKLWVRNWNDLKQ